MPAVAARASNLEKRLRGNAKYPETLTLNKFVEDCGENFRK